METLNLFEQENIDGGSGLSWTAGFVGETLCILGEWLHKNHVGGETAMNCM